MTLLLSATLFLSAFLLFFCEPMVAKMILPILGGSASVWTTCVVFFQIMLLVGYGYAHFLAKLGRLRDQHFVHLSLLIVALGFLPIRFGTVVAGDASRAPVAWIFLHLFMAVGLPFAVISATAPLVQKWLAQTTLLWADDPYFLYAVSNVGSLLALAAYPIAFEPRFGVQAQSRLWLYAYVGLLGPLAASMWMIWRVARLPSRIDTPAAAEFADSVPWRTRLQWLAAAFVPSALTLAVTNHISMNLGAFPFLWVAPLSLYLLTFVIAFARKIRVPTTVISSIATVILLLFFPIVTVGAPVRSSELPPLIAAHLLILFASALLCHSFLAQRRPATAYLTEFYFFLALGGVLGGAFIAILAPSIFTTVFEYPLLVASVVFFRQLRKPAARFNGSDAFDLLLFALFTAFVMFAVLSWGKVDVSRASASLPVVAAQSALVLALLLFRRKPLQFGIAFSSLVVTYAIVLPREFEGATRVHIARDFFGVKKVLFEPDINMRKLLHGDTLHGRESLDQNLVEEPLSYYHRTGPVGDAMQLLEKRPQQRVGVVGLGSGTIAAYGTQKRHITFFDVDPQMIDIASQYFMYLHRCNISCDVVVGDGRLSTQSQPDAQFDLLILDAFNSDSIPAHLVSRDAVRMYMSKLKPNGLLMFHVSNRYLDVEKLVSSVLTAEGIPAFVRHDTDEDPPGKSGSHYVVGVRNPEELDGMPHRIEWVPVDAHTGIRPWTDDFSDLVSILK